MKKLNKKGFTLIEMLVVIAIIAILVAIIIPTVSNATEKAKESADAANIRSIAAEMQIKYLTADTPAADSTTYTLTQTGNWEHVTNIMGVTPPTGTSVTIAISADGELTIGGVAVTDPDAH